MSAPLALRSLAVAAFAVLAPLAAAQTPTIVADDAFPGVSFSTPVGVVWAPGDASRAYVVEQGAGGPARIRTVAMGSTAVTTFVDLSDRVSAGGEMGLLGMAFHPDYATNGKVYVSYTANNPRRSVVSEMLRSTSNPLELDRTTERVLFTQPQPFSNHNGGHILFGPDGYLYIAIGDGGSGGDPQNNAQTRTTLLGKLLRIDVDTQTPGGLAYGIPADNPFVGNANGWREEIYAYGLRNSWKFSFDSATGALWLGDVGQGQWEEIDIIQSGGNYGWKQVEGPTCFVSGCDLSLYEAPLFWYGHNSAGGFSITGGFVYHGTAAPSLDGQYLYADFVSPKLWALDVSGASPTNQLLLTSISNISAVIEGPDGEAYPVSYNGTIYRLRQDPVSSNEAADRSALVLRVTGAQPFGHQATLEATLAEAGSARVTLHDALGRQIAVLHDGALAAGVPLQLTVDGRGLAAGVYLVRLDAGAAGASVARLVRAR